MKGRLYDVGIPALGSARSDHLWPSRPSRGPSCLHDWHKDEAVYVLSGEGTAFLREDSFLIKTGDFIGYRKGGLAHSIKNTGSETLHSLVIGQRLPHDVGDYPNKAKRIYRNEGLAWSLVDHDAIEKVNAGAKK